MSWWMWPLAIVGAVLFVALWDLVASGGKLCAHLGNRLAPDTRFRTVTGRRRIASPPPPGDASVSADDARRRQLS